MSIVRKHMCYCICVYNTAQIYNAASTGGHVIRGKVARNRMIDVKVTNSKLLERGLTIVEEFANCNRLVAKASVLCAIHELDNVPEDISKQVGVQTCYVDL